MSIFARLAHHTALCRIEESVAEIVPSRIFLRIGIVGRHRDAVVGGAAEQ
jgi:hypothetical protein